MGMMGCEEHSPSFPKGSRSPLFNQDLGKTWGLDINNLFFFLPPLPVVAQAKMLPEAAGRLSPAWQVVLAYGEVLQNWVQERSGRCLPGLGEKPALPEGSDCRCLSRCRQHVVKQMLSLLLASSSRTTLPYKSKPKPV